MSRGQWHHRALLAALFLVALTTAGCFTTSGRMHGLAAELERDSPHLELDHQFGLTLGRISLGLTKGLANSVALDDEDEELLKSFRGIKKVEIANFEAHADGDVELPVRLAASFERRGWQTLARFREDDEFAWVLCRIRKGKLNNVMMMVLEDEELTLIRLGGRLDKVLTAALAFVGDEMRGDDQLRAEGSVELGR